MKANNLSLTLIAHTCPIVDELEYRACVILQEKKFLSDEQLLIVEEVIGNYTSHIKDKVTEKLRDQLIHACENWLYYEESVKSIEKELSYVINERDNLSDENNELLNEINTLNNTIYDLENK